MLDRKILNYNNRMIAMSLTPPKTIDHRYQVLGPLGAGLSGEIFRVQGPEGLAALKLLKAEATGMDLESWIATFKFEFSLLKDLNHPNVIRIFDFGFDEKLNRFYFTQELVEGAPIDESLPQEPAAGLNYLQELFVQALQGLAYLHNHDVLHGDLKAGNLLIHQANSPKPTLKMIDFGISHPQLVQTAGTPATMAPEKILREVTDARSDLYSLAVVFYSLMTGENPFLRDELAKTLQAHLHFVPPPATQKQPQLAPFWSELFTWMLKKNPRERAPSAAACLKFLETKGENFEIPRQRLLPRHWTGRPEILEAALKFLSAQESKTKEPAILKISGTAGLGQEQLITELKYLAELKDLQVLSSPEDPLYSEKNPAVLLLKPAQLAEIKVPRLLKKIAGKINLVVALTPQSPAAWQKLNTPHQITLRPLNLAETKTYLQETTHNAQIPQAFLAALQRISGGSPQILHEALSQLLKDPKIVDAAGKWHLAVFEEAEPSLEQLGLSESALSQALEQLGAENPSEPWEINLELINQLSQSNQESEALKKLNALEKQVPKIFALEERLFRKAQILEKRGYLYTKQGRFNEGRKSFTAGLSLLKESETPHPTLEIRLENFLAYLDLQEGKQQEAIAQFQNNAKVATKLSLEEQRLITNNELGSAYLAAGDLTKASERLKEDLQFFLNLGLTYPQMKASYNLAETYYRQNRLPEAMGAYEQSAKIARRERHWDFLLRAYHGMGNTAGLQKNRLEALDYYQRALGLAEYLQDYLSTATIVQNRGVLLTELSRLSEAKQNLELSKRWLSKVQPSSHSRHLMARAILELGEVSLKEQDFEMARSQFREALSRAEEDPNLKSFRFYPLLALGKLALTEGKPEKLQEFAPQLLHLAQGETEKKLFHDLMARMPEANESTEAKSTTQSPSQSKATDSNIVVTQIKTPQAPSSRSFSEEALYSILKVNRALISEHDLEKLFARILEYATDLSEAESALLLEVSEDNALSVRAAYNTTADQAEKEISQHIAARVLASGESIATHDALGDQDFKQFESVISLKLRSIACIPIRLHQKVIALLYLTHRNRTQVFRPDVLQLMEAFGNQAGLALHNAQLMQQLNQANDQLRSQLSTAESYIDQLKTNLRSKLKNPYTKILGQSPAMVELLKTLDRISDTALSVLILGETGSGKELVARGIHDHSRRKDAPFVAVNCGAIPENLMESELFGYMKGAFTGADRDKKGLIETANGGTLFLDEVAELPASLQVKLLRVLQEKEVVRLGATQATPVDVRVVAATHRHLEQWVAEERFREDLYYRLAQMVMSLPPLRERLEDLPLLTEHFLSLSAKETGEKKPPRLSKELLDKMVAYPWPGNVRELENMIRTASAFAERGRIHWEHLPKFLQDKLQTKTPLASATKTSPIKSVNKTREATRPDSMKSSEVQDPTKIPFYPDWDWARYEAALLAQSYLAQQQNCEAVANDLQIGIATVYLKIRKYKLKENLSLWSSANLTFPKGLNLQELKKYVIQKSYVSLGKSAYSVAKQLGLNVGTVYRYLRQSDAKSSRP